MQTFEGFPKQTLTFLRGLAKHNDKDWFLEHREAYDEWWLAPARAFVAAMGPRLQVLAPVQAVPAVNGSIFRINRDIRFATDKRPYKEYLDFWFWEGRDRHAAPSGFYVRLTSKALALGAGIRGFSPEQLERYRSAVDDDRAGRALLAVQRKLAKAGYACDEPRYKRVPAGFDPEHPRAELLRHDALYAGIVLAPLPASVSSSALLRACIGHFVKLQPLHRWLVDHTSG